MRARPDGLESNHDGHVILRCGFCKEPARGRGGVPPRAPAEPARLVLPGPPRGVPGPDPGNELTSGLAPLLVGVLVFAIGLALGLSRGPAT